MNAFLVIPAAIAGLVLASAGAIAQGAKPENPSGYGHGGVARDAKANGGNGEASRTGARQPDGRGYSDVVQEDRQAFNSTPNPPGKQ